MNFPKVLAPEISVSRNEVGCPISPLIVEGGGFLPSRWEDKMHAFASSMADMSA